MNVFFGDQENLLVLLHQKIGINLVVMELRKTKQSKMYSFAIESQIKVLIVSDKIELNNLVEKSVNDNSLGFVSSFGLIFAEKAIKKFRYLINCHPGNFEINRGRHPLPWAIYNGEKFMGVTIHLIDSKLIDAGAIIREVKIPINYNLSYNRNYNLLNNMIIYLLISVLDELTEFKSLNSINIKLKTNSYQNPMDKQLLADIINSVNLLRFKK